MTTEIQLKKQKSKYGRLSQGQLLLGSFGIFCLFLILRNSEIAIEYMSRGLMLCAKTVIPSLFPFMVISELIISGGIANKLLKKICKPFCKLFRISADGCCAVLLGMLCGFPIGARCTVLSLEEGKISQEEAERILCFSNNPSSAFLISAVGGSLWGNSKFGVALYLTVLSASVITGILSAHIFKHAPHAKHTQKIEPLSAPARSSSRVFCDAVRSSVGSMLLVCAYVVFFSALVGTFRYLPVMNALPMSLQSFLFCLFELSGGVSQACALASPMTAALLCAFAVGWSGISVHCQILGICDGKPLSLRPYTLAKIFQALLCPLIFALILTLFPELLIPEIGI